MNALLPIICLGTPGPCCGVPEMMFSTSPLDRPQNEQLNRRAFIFAIIKVSTHAKLIEGLLAVRDNFIY
jgi:hypothetical protein